MRQLGRRGSSQVEATYYCSVDGSHTFALGTAVNRNYYSNQIERLRGAPTVNQQQEYPRSKTPRNPEKVELAPTGREERSQPCGT